MIPYQCLLAAALMAVFCCCSPAADDVAMVDGGSNGSGLCLDIDHGKNINCSDLPPLEVYDPNFLAKYYAKHANELPECPITMKTMTNGHKVAGFFMDLEKQPGGCRPPFGKTVKL